MDLSVKLIWDFRGADALQFAKHHALHLKEFIDLQTNNHFPCGFEERGDAHCIAYILTNRENMITLRDQLKPHRAEKHEPKAE